MVEDVTRIEAYYQAILGVQTWAYAEFADKVTTIHLKWRRLDWTSLKAIKNGPKDWGYGVGERSYSFTFCERFDPRHTK